ncbi:hypothetical protein LE36_19235 [Salmonella enterica subsp. diarizonae]|nr:hypothetical protein [Salmonella enterica subsp. diarizonae]HAD5968622.1 hypothetical protein [Salmonella enterica subsp. enterica serovar Typhimurium]
MARNNAIETPGGEATANTATANTDSSSESVAKSFDISTATKEQMLEYFSGYRDESGESIVLDNAFDSLVDMALNPLHVVDTSQPTLTDGKAPHRTPVLTEQGWVV